MVTDHPKPEALVTKLRGIAEDIHRMVSSQYFDFLRQSLRQAADLLEAQQRQLAVARKAVAMIEHAKELGYLGEGSTATWANEVLREAHEAGLGAEGGER